MSIVDYSIVVPVYNAEGSLDVLNKSICHFFESKQYSYEIIYVNDSSIDRSWDILKEIKKTNAKQVLLQFPDGIKPYSTSIANYLKSQVPKTNFIIWLGSC